MRSNLQSQFGSQSRYGPLGPRTRKPHSDDVPLNDLAIQLDGEPIPRLRPSEWEFHQWCDERQKCEWIDGRVLPIPLPDIRHVDLNGWLIALVRTIAESSRSGETLGMLMHVRLPKRRTRRSPDVFLVSRARKRIIKYDYVDGPPDLIMEIVSPDSENRDRRDKYIDYEMSGVREYWIVDPNAQRVKRTPWVGTRNTAASRKSTAGFSPRCLASFTFVRNGYGNRRFRKWRLC